MQDEKSIWEGSVHLMLVDNLPHWPCPTCETGKLLLNRESMYFQESAQQFNQEEFRKENFEEHIILGIISTIAEAVSRLFIRQARFNAFLFCDNKACREVVSVCGRAEVPSALQKNDIKTKPQILPEYFSPPLKIFPLIKEYPQAVREELARSFTVFFADTSAAGNKLRLAIERLMDTLNIADSSRKLHIRLEQFQKQYPELGEILMDVKWLGNEASHNSELSKKKILDGYLILEYVLKQLFIQPIERDKIKKLSQGLRKCNSGLRQTQ